jgi:hypothetical protein
MHKHHTQQAAMRQFAALLVSGVRDQHENFNNVQPERTPAG